MATCGNCKGKLNCSCKMRKASDGKSCCVNCVTKYNKLLLTKKTTSTNTTPGVILSATAIQKE